MKNLDESPADYFDKFSTAPVSIKPFGPDSKAVANRYLERLQNLLADVQVDIRHRGSTAFGIAGKGDIEFGVYPSAENWASVVQKLECFYGKAQNTEDDYIRFNDRASGYEIEVIVLGGYPAKVDMKLTEYLQNHPELLKEYEHVKKQSAFSKREYQREKDKFLRTVVAMIPDDEMSPSEDE